MLKELAALMPCPECHATGQSYSTRHHTLVVCGLCHGRLFMPSATCKGCGRPAVKMWPPRQRPIVEYCGLEACLTLLVTIHKPSSVAPAYPTLPNIVHAAIMEDVDRAARKHHEEIHDMRRVLGPNFRLNERL